MTKVFGVIITLIVIFNFSSCSEQIQSSTDKPEATIVTDDDFSDYPLWVNNLDYTYLNLRRWTTAAIETDDFVYYLSKTGVNKFNKENNSDVKVVEDDSVKGLSCYDGLIYYFNDSEIKYIDNNDIIHEVWNTSLSEPYDEFGFIKYMDYIYDFWIHDNLLYVMDSNISAFKVDLSTYKMEDLCRDFSELAFIGDDFYYVEHAGRTYSIYKENLNNDEVSIVRGDGITVQYETDKECYHNVMAVGDNLFYIKSSPFEVYKYDENGNDILVSSKEIIKDSFWCHNNYLFYEKKTENGVELYEYDVEKESERLILSEEFDSYLDVLITSSSVVYRNIDRTEIYYMEIDRSDTNTVTNQLQ